MADVIMKVIETEFELKEVLEICFKILGTGRQGITKGLMRYFENIAVRKGGQYITLGSKEDAFYEKCGYNVIFQIEGQNVYQKSKRLISG